jgi:hypothetical protein
MALTGNDPKNHQRVVQKAMRRHYRDIVTKNKIWYIIEDKLSFSPIFTLWYANSLQGLGERVSSESDEEASYTRGRFTSK